MRNKEFDCVEMMHKAQEQILKETEGLTDAEFIEYWRRKSIEAKEKLHVSTGNPARGG